MYKFWIFTIWKCVEALFREKDFDFDFVYCSIEKNLRIRRQWRIRPKEFEWKWKRKWWKLILLASENFLPAEFNVFGKWKKSRAFISLSPLKIPLSPELKLFAGKRVQKNITEYVIAIANRNLLGKWLKGKSELPSQQTTSSPIVSLCFVIVLLKRNPRKKSSLIQAEPERPASFHSFHNVSKTNDVKFAPTRRLRYWSL